MAHSFTRAGLSGPSGSVGLRGVVEAGCRGCRIPGFPAHSYVIGMEPSAQPTAWIENGPKGPLAIQGSFSIGRSSSNELALEDRKASRNHAMIHEQGDAEFFIVDLGSSNGTYVAGKRVVQPTRLTDGVEIQIGETHLTSRQPVVQDSSFFEESGSGTLMDVRMVRSWLLLADLQGSTRLSQEMPAEELARLTGRWFSECRQVIERHGGAVNKFLGDGFLAYWPATRTDLDLLIQGLLALKQLQASSAVAFRIVLHQGSVILGGGPTMGEENLSGPEVNFTFRIEKLAGGLNCAAMMSAAARTHLDGRLVTTSLGQHPVSGFPGTPEFFAF